MSEIWLSVVGYEGLYEVSDNGRRGRNVRRSHPRGIQAMNMRRRRKHCAHILGRDQFYRDIVSDCRVVTQTVVIGRRCTRTYYRKLRA